jgi:hypothetical protein
MTSTQRSLAMPVNQRTVLVDTNGVRMAMGIDADSVFALVDHGQLRWVFDVSTRGAIRELRYWAAEVIAPEQVARLELDQVVDRILPRNRAWLHGSEIAHLLLVSRPTVSVLREQMRGEIVGHSIRAKREDVARFLASRHAAALVGRRAA